MRIKELMSTPVVSCPATSTLDHAARLMWEFDCGIVPVLDNDGRPAGIVTDRDVCMAAYTQGQPLHAIPVTSAMARRVIAVHTGDSVESAERLMREHQIRRLPVLDGEGRAVGLVSMNDLARAAGHGRRSAAEHDIVSTMAAICQPRRPAFAPDAKTRLATVAG